MSTFKDRSVIREIGKVMCLSKGEIELPNQRSIHAGGVFISAESITYHIALDLPFAKNPTSRR